MLAPDFQFDDAYLLQELGKPAPSLASGVAETLKFYDDKEEDCHILWLLERKHASEVIIRFNGTLYHPSSATDLKHLTIYAFGHYVYEVTKGQLIFADIQGELEF